MSGGGRTSRGGRIFRGDGVRFEHMMKSQDAVEEPFCEMHELQLLVSFSIH